MTALGLMHVVDAWVAEREIADATRSGPDVDGDFSLRFGYTITGQSFDVFIDVRADGLGVYIYAPVTATEDSFDQLLRVAHWHNSRMRMGCLEVVGKKRAIRFRAAMPARPDSLAPEDIDHLVQIVGDAFHEMFPTIGAVIFFGAQAADLCVTGSDAGQTATVLN